MSVKRELIKILSLSPGRFFSGAALADTLGVSRNAVWKAVEALRKDGYEISAVTNKGYSLCGGTAVLSAEAVCAFADSRLDGVSVKVFESIDSTNAEAKRVADKTPGPLLILAEQQTAGRGRLGRSFYSPPGTGLYMSLMYHPDTSLSENLSVTAAAAVAVVRAIEKLTDMKPQIKWVNDIFINGKKVCGILTEAVTDFESGTDISVIVGIGINVTTESFPPEVGETAASIGVSRLDRNRLASEVAAELLRLIKNLGDRSFMEDYRQHSMVIGREITYIKNGISHSATAISIDDDGGLKVSGDQGITVLNTGEITLRVK